MQRGKERGGGKKVAWNEGKINRPLIPKGTGYITYVYIYIFERNSRFKAASRPNRGDIRTKTHFHGLILETTIHSRFSRSSTKAWTSACTRLASKKDIDAFNSNYDSINRLSLSTIFVSMTKPPWRYILSPSTFHRSSTMESARSRGKYSKEKRGRVNIGANGDACLSPRLLIKRPIKGRPVINRSLIDVRTGKGGRHRVLSPTHPSTGWYLCVHTMRSGHPFPFFFPFSTFAPIDRTQPVHHSSSAR